MKRIYYFNLKSIISGLLLVSCEASNEPFPEAATLKIAHAASGAPAVHVDYFDIDELNFSVNPALDFGSGERFTIPANETRDIQFIYAEDTTRVVFDTKVMLEAGQIATFYLKGDSASLSGFLLTETFQNYTDSIFGVNFIHAATEQEAVAVRTVRTDTAGVKDTTMVSTSLTAEASTGFVQYEATGRIDEYTFEYLNASDSILTSFSIDPLRRRREKVFRNISLPLIGKPDDGEGNSTLQVVQIDNF